MSTFEDQIRFRVLVQTRVRSVHTASIMNASEAPSDAEHRAALPHQGYASPKSYQATTPDQDFMSTDTRTLTLMNMSVHAKPMKPSYEVLPPEIWLLILRDCPTSSLKNLAQVDKTLHDLVSDQLLRTVVLGQGTLGKCVLDKTLDNATVIKDPAAFSALVLNHKHLRWYKVTKAVFVVYRTATFVVRLSALPLMCYYITQTFAPEQLDKFKWTVWLQKRKLVTITLWPVSMWPVNHPIMDTLDTSGRPLIGDIVAQDD